MPQTYRKNIPVSTESIKPQSPRLSITLKEFVPRRREGRLEKEEVLQELPPPPIPPTSLLISGSAAFMVSSDFFPSLFHALHLFLLFSGHSCPDLIDVKRTICWFLPPLAPSPPPFPPPPFSYLRFSSSSVQVYFVINLHIPYFLSFRLFFSLFD